jgi:hypothetical protein
VIDASLTPRPETDGYRNLTELIKAFTALAPIAEEAGPAALALLV